MDLLLVASASHQQEEEGRGTGSKVNREVRTVFLDLVASTSHQQEEEDRRTGSKVNREQCFLHWLPQPVTRRRIRVENRFQGKKITVRMFLAPDCLSQSPAGIRRRRGELVLR